MSILEVNNVSKSFGGVKANVDISMSVEKGKIFGLIGPNGSGKTTLFNSIVGTYPIDNGSIKFNGKEVSSGRSAVSKDTLPTMSLNFLISFSVVVEEILKSVTFSIFVKLSLKNLELSSKSLPSSATIINAFTSSTSKSAFDAIFNFSL